MTLDAAFDLIFLDPTKVTLFRTGGDAVRLTVSDPQVGEERTYLSTQIARAFPLSKPDTYIGLRDSKDKDIGMLLSLDGLAPESRKIAEDELNRRYFLPRVIKVNKVKKEFETVTFDVVTDRGPRVYTVQNMRESSLEVSPGRVLVSDRTGARFEIPDVNAAGKEVLAVMGRVLG
jgi:hypothetical protein